MPKGICDPGVGNFNVEELAYGDAGADVRIKTRFGWDGVSVFPDCIGSVQDVHIVNHAAFDWFVEIPHSRRGPINFRCAPGTDKTYSGAQLALVGIQTNQDISELNWTQIRPSGTVVDLP